MTMNFNNPKLSMGFIKTLVHGSISNPIHRAKRYAESEPQPQICYPKNPTPTENECLPNVHTQINKEKVIEITKIISNLQGTNIQFFE